MKFMKKTLAMVLAILMVLSLATTAFADMEGELTDGSITINDAVSGQTYSAYQILYLESYNADSNAYAYKANSEWADWLADQDEFVAIDEQGYVTWVNDADVKEFAKNAAAELSNKTAAAAATAESASVTLSGLKLGYYLVDTTLGTLCSLDTTNPNVVMEEKNEEPSFDKVVEEDSNKAWGKINDADINQVVNFKATVTVQKGAENYVVYDNMSAGLTWDGKVTVSVGGNTVEASNYKLSSNVTVGEVVYDFAVAFNNDYIATLAAGTEIVINYSATLNEDAVVGAAGNPNEAILKYGDENHPSWTPKKETKTYTWDLKIVKYTKQSTTDENGETTTTEVMLAGATFKLSYDAEGEKVLTFHKIGENEYEFCADVCEKAEEDHITEITTDATGKFHIEGLDADTYYLTETAAPSGYNKLEDPIEIVITATADTDNTTLTYETIEEKVENKAGSLLPSTGGMGTTMFYVFGAAMFLGAAVLLITKKRMSFIQ